MTIERGSLLVNLYTRKSGLEIPAIAFLDTLSIAGAPADVPGQRAEMMSS